MSEMSVMPEEAEKNELREMLTAEQVMAKINISRTALWRLESEGLFPQGQLITPHRKLWFFDEVLRWQRDLQDPDSELAKAMKKLRAVKPKKARDHG